MIYFDNAATSWPKPGAVIAAMERFLRECGANPGRSGHRQSIRAGRVVYEARERVARLFDLDDPLSVAFTKNATEALNVALAGCLAPGDHVITSVMEHNSVLRPLHHLEQRGVAVTRLTGDDAGVVGPDEVLGAITPATKMVVLGHASNVTGAIAPLAEIGHVARERGPLFLVDAAQSAGALPISMVGMNIDALAFTGHKALCGPQGTGGLCLGERARQLIGPLLRGGSGSSSDSDVHPDFLPDRLEAGTLNAVGLAGLSAGLAFIEERGVDGIRAHESALASRLLAGLGEIAGVRVYGPLDPEGRVAVISFGLGGLTCSEVAEELEERAGICCRAGLHCAPLAHRRLGTFPGGTVRLSLGPFNDEGEIDTALGALGELAAQKGVAR